MYRCAVLAAPEAGILACRDQPDRETAAPTMRR